MRWMSRVYVVSCALGLAALLSVSASLDAQARPRARLGARTVAPTAIALGHFAPLGERSADGDLEGAIRTALASHPSVTLSADRSHARFLVTGSVVELSHHVLTPQEREVRCRVSVVVADARGGAVRAMLEGRAGVRGGGSEASMRRSAVAGAVASALRSIPQVR